MENRKNIEGRRKAWASEDWAGRELRDKAGDSEQRYAA